MACLRSGERSEQRVIERNIGDQLSYYIKPGGPVTAVMPDQDETFSLKFIQDFVGPHVELACYTPEGYALVRDVNADQEGLPINDVASSILAEATGQSGVIRGRAFLIHPKHFDRRLVPAA
ncbi:MAG: hypothetical protein JO249_08235 [Acidobacteria bacterium]|nr:hypothetical protein [Acidobacteriota bacterium]